MMIKMMIMMIMIMIMMIMIMIMMKDRDSAHHRERLCLGAPARPGVLGAG